MGSKFAPKLPKLLIITEKVFTVIKCYSLCYPILNLADTLVPSDGERLVWSFKDLVNTTLIQSRGSLSCKHTSREPDCSLAKFSEIFYDLILVLKWENSILKHGNQNLCVFDSGQTHRDFLISRICEII